MSKLNTPVFEIIDGEVVEGTLADYMNLVEQTTTPRGVAPVYFVQAPDEEKVKSLWDAKVAAEKAEAAATEQHAAAELLGSGADYNTVLTALEDARIDLQRAESEYDSASEYGLHKWTTWGGTRRLIRSFATEAEAQTALEETFVYDITNDSEHALYYTRESAEQFLREGRADL